MNNEQRVLKLDKINKHLNQVGKHISAYDAGDIIRIVIYDNNKEEILEVLEITQDKADFYFIAAESMIRLGSYK